MCKNTHNTQANGTLSDDQTGSIRDIVKFFILWFLLSVAFFAVVSILFDIRNAPAYKSYVFLAYNLVNFIFVLTYLANFCGKKKTTICERLKLRLRIKLNKAVPLYFAITLISSIAGTALVLSGSNGSDFVFMGVFRNLRRLLSSFFGITALGTMVLGPLVEEAAYRGFTYPIFKRRFGTYIGMGATSLLFTIQHYTGRENEPLALFAVFFLFAIFLNIVYEKEQNLLWCIILHAMSSWLVIAIAYPINH